MPARRGGSCPTFNSSNRAGDKQFDQLDDNDAISTEKPFDGNREAGLSGQARSPLALTLRNASDDIHPLHVHAAASNSLASVANRLRVAIKDVVMLAGFQEVTVRRPRYVSAERRFPCRLRSWHHRRMRAFRIAGVRNRYFPELRSFSAWVIRA